MRRVTFSMGERIVLIPVELSHLPKPTIWLLPAIFLLSGIGTNFFSFNDAFSRGLMVLTAYAAGILGGAVVAPVLLPWIPVRAFALKGMLTGIAAGLAVVAIFYSSISLGGSSGPASHNHGDKFLSGDEFYRLHALHFTVGSRKGNAQGHPPAGGSRFDRVGSVGGSGI